MCCPVVIGQGGICGVKRGAECNLLCVWWVSCEREAAGGYTEIL